MLRPILTSFAVAVLLAACGGQANQDHRESQFNPEQLSEQEAAWADMMEAHDRVMPRMGEIYQATKALIPLMQAAQAEADDYHARAQRAIQNLDAAEDGMMQWMAGIRDQPLDSLRAQYDHAAIMANIDKETIAIEKVEADIESSINTAQALIQERTNSEE